jgi:membrane protein implicated in regulation of membrane protease activity
VLRPVASILIGAVLALLLAFASQFLLLPFIGTRGVTTLSPVTTGVFWLVFAAVLLYVVVTVYRGRR